MHLQSSRLQESQGPRMASSDFLQDSGMTASWGCNPFRIINMMENQSGLLGVPLYESTLWVTFCAAGMLGWFGDNQTIPGNIYKLFILDQIKKCNNLATMAETTVVFGNWWGRYWPLLLNSIPNSLWVQITSDFLLDLWFH